MELTLEALRHHWEVECAITTWFNHVFSNFQKLDLDREYLIKFRSYANNMMEITTNVAVYDVPFETIYKTQKEFLENDPLSKKIFCIGD